MRTLIVLVTLALLYFILHWQYRRNPLAFTKKFLYWGAVLLAISLALLVATGRLHWLYALIAALIPFVSKIMTLLRYLPIIKSIRSALGGNNKQHSHDAGSFAKVECRYFRMELNSATGEMNGTILEGAHQGKSLSELNKEQLVSLLRECQRSDKESALLLATYMARYYGEQWREKQTGGRSDEMGEDMSRARALDILGLREPVAEADIIKAHRQLIQKFHPDRGGSNYLAAKINTAKDYLLNK